MFHKHYSVILSTGVGVHRSHAAMGWEVHIHPTSQWGRRVHLYHIAMGQEGCIWGCIGEGGTSRGSASGDESREGASVVHPRVHPSGVQMDAPVT